MVSYTQYVPHPTIVSFFKTGRALQYAKGELIVHAKDEPNGVYYIEDGYVKAYTITHLGDESIHIIYGKGELFPSSWIAAPHRQDIYFEALGKVLVWRVSKEAFLNEAQTSPEFAFALVRQIASQFNVYSDRIENLEFRFASERVAYKLLFLAARFGRKQKDGIIIRAPITQGEIAGTINLSRESVARQLQKLNKKGYVSYENRKLIVKDVVGLNEKMLNGAVDLKDWGLK